MKSNGSVNRVYRIVWNAAKAVWQAVCETSKARAKGRPGYTARSLRRAAVVGIGMTLASGSVFAAPAANELPTGGTVVGGTATISASNSRMDVQQTSNRAAIDWATFNIGSQAQVHFEQPAGGAVLNRVLDTNASEIYGRLTSTGLVFLVNPQGIYFAPGAQVDVGSLIASTLDIGNTDFLNGKLSFQGTSANAIVNQGNIVAAEGGTIALIAARITNEGNLTADGGNVLLGAGNKVTLDMGGPVKIRVDEGAVNALITQGGAIRADGGLVYLTAKSAGDLVSTVINHTGITEARTLATGKTGEIYLMGGMDKDQIKVGGTLDASAPNGGNGGSIETSAATVTIDPAVRVTTKAVNGANGTWLIDPVDITIDQTLANTIQTALNSGNVTISTAGGNTPDTSSGESSLGSERGDINFNGNLAWNANTLVLRADNDIWIRGALTGTGTAKLGLEYGQVTSGSTSNMTAYTILGSVSLPTNSFYAKFGTNGSTAFTNMPTFLNNGFLRFGNGTADSVDQYGSLLQPFYYNTTDKRWYKLTYSNSPMYLNVGFDGIGFSDGTIISNQQGKASGSGFDNNPGAYVSTTSVNTSGYSNGRGTLVATNTITDGGVTLTMQSTYTLRQGASYLEAITKITNSGATAVDNVRLWSGTRDDWIGLTDGPRKEKGSLVNGAFVANTATGQASNAIRVTSNTEGILFFSTSTGAETTIGSCCTPNFQIDTGAGGTGLPLVSPRDTAYDSGPLSNNYSTDGNYSVYSLFGSLATSANKSIVWYYAAGAVGNLAAIVQDVTQAADVAVANLDGPAAPPAAPTNSQFDAAIVEAQGLPRENFAPTTPSSSDMVSPNGTSPADGLAFVNVPAPPNDSPADTGSPGSTGGGSTNGLPSGMSERDPLGFMRVFVVAGGINLPKDASTRNSAQ
jgi:filamentous hemagglutinin family protein